MRLVLASFPGDGSLRARPAKDCLGKGLSARARMAPVKMFNEVFFYTIRDRSPSTSLSFSFFSLQRFCLVLALFRPVDEEEATFQFVSLRGTISRLDISN